MHLHKPSGGGRYRPFAATRYRLKHGLLSTLLRDDPSTFDRPLSDDVLSDLGDTARREIRGRVEGGAA